MSKARERTRRLAALIGLLACISVLPASGQEPRDEQLFVGVPDGWEKIYEAAEQEGSITEYVPKGETTEKWTEMVTLQRYNAVLLDIPSYLEQVIQRFTEGCVVGRHDGPRRAVESAYPAAVAFIECRGPDPAKATPGVLLKSIEFVAIKAIQGRDALYVVQRAWHGNDPAYHPLNFETANQWLAVVRDAELCNLADRSQTCRSIGRTGNLN
jgi:hypothetical protein